MIDETNFKDQVLQIIQDYLQSSAFSDRKVTDTPTDALQVANKKYVDSQGSTPIQKVPTPPSDATQFLNGAATPAFANVKDSDLATTDVTTNDVTSSKHGFTPKTPSDSTKFLNGSSPAAWSVPPGTIPWNNEGGVTWAAETTDKSITISNGFTRFIYVLFVSIDSSAGTTLGLQFNSDTGTNYQYRSNNDTAIVKATGQNQLQLMIGGGGGVGMFWFNGTKDANNRIYVAGHGAVTIGAANQIAFLDGTWSSADGNNLTSITLTVGSSSTTGGAHLYSLQL